MTLSIPPTGPSLEELFAQFPPAADLPSYEVVPPGEVPSPFQELLVHEHHMTVTVESLHKDLVDVRVLQENHQEDNYARKIILTLQKSQRVVLFGIVLIDLALCAPPVRQAIVAKKTPLGRILIENDVMRRIEPTAFFRIHPGPEQLRWFALEQSQPMFGRLAYIHCDDQPAIELLEIVISEPGGRFSPPA